MKVFNIEKEKNIYYVMVKPNWLEKLFGKKHKTLKLKKTDSHYSFGGQNIYKYPDGTVTDNGDYIVKAIDNHNRKI